MQDLENTIPVEVLTPKETTKFELSPNTIYLLVGPSKCGKSTFCERAESFAVDNGVTSAIISSDELRGQLTDWAFTYGSHQHKEVSEGAFKLLLTELEVRTKFPVNTSVIFVDTTGLSEYFRDSVLKIAEQNHYNVEMVLFNFSGRDFRKGANTEHELNEINRQLATLKTKVLPYLNSKAYRKITRISKPPEYTYAALWDDSIVPDFEFTLNPLFDLVKKCTKISRETTTYAVIGDIHEHTEPLVDLVANLKAEFGPKIQLILVGDYLDKGGRTKEAVETIRKLYEDGAWIVCANHEAYIANRLKGKIDPNAELESKYFASLKYLMENPEQAMDFLEIYDNSYPFLKITSDYYKTVYITHAPCMDKYLGKVDGESQKKQRNLYYTQKTQPLHEAVDFVYKEASFTNPYHIFGHASHASPKIMCKNKVFLDTGSVYGNALTAFVIKHDIEAGIEGKVLDRSNNIRSLKTLPLVEPKYPLPTSIFPPEVEASRKAVNYGSLSEDEIHLVERLNRSQIKYISGTMAPSQSVKKDGVWDIESLEAGLDVFRKAGIQSVHMQPKYMGSRGQMYLFPEREKCFVASRRGYTIRKNKHVEEMLDTQHQKWVSLQNGDHVDFSVVLDGEILPWSVLGGGLIQNSFKDYASSINYGLQRLQDDKLFASFGIVNVDEKMECLKAFQKQVELFCGKPGEAPTYFQPFDILSKNGLVVSRSDPAKNYGSLNDKDGGLVIDFSQENYLALAEAYFKSLTFDNGMEGVVLKPFVSSDEKEAAETLKKVPAYLKVRNKEYLRLIYGYDYTSPERFEILCNSKKTGRKTKLSIEEHNMGLELLTAEGQRRKDLIVKLTLAIKEEATLDPRL